MEMRLFSTIMTLGTPRDVTLQELRLETFFPADEDSAAVWTRLISTELADSHRGRDTVVRDLSERLAQEE